MGLYIEHGGLKRKAEDLLAIPGVEELMLAPMSLSGVPSTHMIVCVVDNGPFQAAGVCYNDQELNDFRDDGTRRSKRWLVVPLKVVAELAPAFSIYRGSFDPRYAEANMQDEKSNGQEREFADVPAPGGEPSLSPSEGPGEPETDSSPQTSCAQCQSDFKEGEEVFEDEEGNLFCSEECQESHEYGS